MMEKPMPAEFEELSVAGAGRDLDRIIGRLAAGLDHSQGNAPLLKEYGSQPTWTAIDSSNQQAKNGGKEEL